jgi:phosphomannomutase
MWQKIKNLFKPTAWIFDVDGTLTPSRRVINWQFEMGLRTGAKHHHYFVVTGSDKSKTVEQLGEPLYNSFRKVYQCSGNDVWIGDQNVYTSDWELDDVPWKFLETRLNYSSFPHRTGKHMERRPGMLNFSIVGRMASLHHREKYIEWDKQTNEREIIAAEFNTNFSEKYNVIAQIGGETGLDIMPIGCDKEQIFDDFSNYGEIIFFGDKTLEGGNDHSLAQKIKQDKTRNNTVYQVENWMETRDFLQQELDSRTP